MSQAFRSSVSSRNHLLPWIFLLIIVVSFFTISFLGFYLSDDYIDGEITSLADAFRRTGFRYMNWGGGLLSTFFQNLFCGLFRNHKILFDLVNTLAFGLLVWSAGTMTAGGRDRVYAILLFALVFWFFCPAPNQSLFWVVGSTAYLWTHALAFLFLLTYEKKRGETGSFWYRLCLFLFSFLAASSLIPCVSICGAFVVYYLFHIREVKGNVVPMALGFALGSIVLIVAPGNFVRAAADPGTVEHFLLFKHPVRELLKYRMLWLFVIAWLWGLWKDRDRTLAWARDNSFLLLTLFWSVVALSIVFSPARRAWLFTEALSMLLLLRFLLSFDWKRVLGERSGGLKRFRNGLILVALVPFLVDAGLAMRETRAQDAHNKSSLAQIKAANGRAGVDKYIPAHRMANAPVYPEWAWNGIARELGLDVVEVYPYYCQEKYYGQSSLGENVFFDEKGLLCTDDFYGTLTDECILVIRLQESETHAPVQIRIEYSRPHKWYRKWLDRIKHYQYDRSTVIKRNEPNVVLGDYGYYVVYLKKENTLKGVEVRGVDEG